MHPNVKALIERDYAPQKSEEWLALRQGMLTASDAATAIGKNPYVKRDREWWATYFPVMKEFWDKVLYFREHIDELPKPKEKKKRVLKEKVHVCEVASDPDDNYCSE